MHIDARKLSANNIIEGDICIIGTGPAGLSIALDWMNTPYKVILLEAGGFEYDDSVQDMLSGDATGQRYFPLRSTRLAQFGGTSGHWAGMCSPFDEIDFEKRDWVPNSEWPISKKDLEPYYEQAHFPLKLGPYNYDLGFWQEQWPNLNPFPLDENVIWNKVWQLSKVSGWNGGLKQAYQDLIIKAPNIQLYTYATLVDIKGNEPVNSVQEVEINNRSNNTLKVRAKHYILAMGAIQNARMLLASNRQAKNGLGNDHDLVGRFFMEHLEVDTAEMWLLKPFPTELNHFNQQLMFWNELALRKEVLRNEKILNGTCGLSPTAYARHVTPRIDVWQNEDPRESVDNIFKSWDEAEEKAKAHNQGAIMRAFTFQTRMEQSPNPNSRITLSEKKDAFGVPLANLNWELSPLDKRSLRRINQIMAKEVGKAGIARVKLNDFLIDESDDSFPKSTNGGWHHMGTTRMGASPNKGVVDIHCQVHGINNLHVAGSGCYVTSGAPNPTLTLVAFALRLSDRIKERIKQES
ncbi:GMC oxidoreductase [Pararhodonellum marinum]|uniref:GMC oxidoreductase n=1 Tax=Pararhodonellum marinum TaxID=2755358 RepID=UPI00188F2916|nr:GMC family oxidoreductase [Pararhodonellum marinum]